jgi:DNA repair protein RadC
MVRERTLVVARDEVRNTCDARAVAHAMIGAQPHESLIVMMLDGRNRIRHVATVAMGGIHGLSVALSDIFRPAVAAGVSAIVLAHNHPSGDATASDEDVTLTRRAIEAGKVLGIQVLDHVIVTCDPRESSSHAECGKGWA